MFIQQEGGTRKSVEKGIAWVRMALKQLEDTPRVEMGMKDLVIGAECGEAIIPADWPEMLWWAAF